jgi:Zn-dependent protease with chaperone function
MFFVGSPVVLLLAVFVIGGMKLLRLPFWLIFSILVAAGWTAGIIAIHDNYHHVPGRGYVGLTAAVIVATILLLAWMYAFARWGKRYGKRYWEWDKKRRGIKDDDSDGDLDSGAASESTSRSRDRTPSMPHEPPAVLQFRDHRRTFDPGNVFRMVWRSVTDGFKIEPFAPIAALLCGWTLVWLALWWAALGAFIGLLVGFGVGTGAGFFTLPAGATSLGIVTAVVGAAVGAVAFFVAIYLLFAVGGWWSILTSLAVGLVLAAAIAALVIFIERWTLQARGYRRLSDRERDKLEPLIEEVCSSMAITDPPVFLMQDTLVPGAWTHTQYIVITKRSLELERQQLAAMISHELEHYACGDASFGTVVWACAFPVAVLCNLQSLAWNQVGPLVGFITGIMLWPALLLVRYVIGPVTARWTRYTEYRADAAAVDAGYGHGLATLLDAVKVFEPARSGWSQVLVSTHPPIEFRIEAISRRIAAMVADSNQPLLAPQPAI